MPARATGLPSSTKTKRFRSVVFRKEGGEGPSHVDVSARGEDRIRKADDGGQLFDAGWPRSLDHGATARGFMAYTIHERPGPCTLAAMKRTPTSKDWLPLARTERGAAELPTGAAFRHRLDRLRAGSGWGTSSRTSGSRSILKHGWRSGTARGSSRTGGAAGCTGSGSAGCPGRTGRRSRSPAAATSGCAKLFISMDRARAGVPVRHDRGARSRHRAARSCRRTGTGTG